MCNIALVTFLWLQYWSAWLICVHKSMQFLCVELLETEKMFSIEFTKNLVPKFHFLPLGPLEIWNVDRCWLHWWCQCHWCQVMMMMIMMKGCVCTEMLSGPPLKLVVLYWGIRWTCSKRNVSMSVVLGQGCHVCRQRSEGGRRHWSLLQFHRGNDIGLKWNCNDFECVRKPTESRLSLSRCRNKSSRWAEYKR